MATQQTTPPEEQDPRLLMREAVEHFNHAMALRTEMNIRVAKRVTYTVRGIMIGVGIMLVVVFLLLRTLSKHNSDLMHTVDTMNINMASMTVDMGQMRQIMRRMDENVASMAIIVNEVDSMQHDVTAMNASIGKLTESMGTIDHNMTVMTHDITRMTQTFAAMEHTVRGIGGDVNQMANPMKTWGSFFPFR